jgi:hypothetical protein
LEVLSWRPKTVRGGDSDLTLAALIEPFSSLFCPSEKMVIPESDIRKRLTQGSKSALVSNEESMYWQRKLFGSTVDRLITCVEKRNILREEKAYD